MGAEYDGLMFNLLIDSLPYALAVGGEDYAINADAKTMAKITALTESGADDENAAAIEQLRLFYPVMPDDGRAAMLALIDFYQTEINGYGVKQRANAVTDGAQNDKRAYSLTYDANLIYAAFYQQYGITNPGALHWFEFKALLEGLSEECQFVKVMQYRTMKLSNHMGKEEKAFYRKMKRVYALPDKRTNEEKDCDFASALFVL